MAKKLLVFQEILKTTQEEIWTSNLFEEQDMDQGCFPKPGIAGEVYSELQGLQAWMEDQKSILFKITHFEQKINLF